MWSEWIDRVPVLQGWNFTANNVRHLGDWSDRETAQYGGGLHYDSAVDAQLYAQALAGTHLAGSASQETFTGALLSLLAHPRWWSEADEPALGVTKLIRDHWMSRFAYDFSAMFDVAAYDYFPPEFDAMQDYNGGPLIWGQTYSEIPADVMPVGPDGQPNDGQTWDVQYEDGVAALVLPGGQVVLWWTVPQGLPGDNTGQNPSTSVHTSLFVAGMATGLDVSFLPADPGGSRFFQVDYTNVQFDSSSWGYVPTVLNPSGLSVVTTTSSPNHNLTGSLKRVTVPVDLTPYLVGNILGLALFTDDVDAMPPFQGTGAGGPIGAGVGAGAKWFVEAIPSLLVKYPRFRYWKLGETPDLTTAPDRTGIVYR